MREFITAYKEAILFTLLDDPDSEPEFSPEALATIDTDCNAFYDANWELLADAGGSEEQNGIDFWLNRNGHGCGFWSRGYEKEIGESLSKAAHGFGEQDTFIGDDGLIYLQ